jgi:hypothetical protein
VVGRRLAVVALLLALVAVGAAACFSLTFANGSIECSDDPARPCPVGYVCIQDHCWLRGSFLDGGSD